MFLATPSFTHWLDKDDEFLSKAVQQLFPHHVDSPSEIRTISAIIDRIPLHNKTRFEDANVGHEGFSVLLPVQAIRSLSSTSNIAEAAPLKSHVRFVSKLGEEEQCMVALPVANTLFHNGQHSTSFQDLWQWNDLPELGRCLNKISRVPLQSFDIITSGLRDPVFTAIPIEPLTRPQEVASSMGNVVRELKRGDTGESYPASTELEAAVPRFLTNPWLTDAARKEFSVFALITRKGFYDSAKTQVREGIWPPVRQQVLKGLLEGQAQMNRVTGGGGGWGNKKGLLSLEPGDDLFDSQHSQRIPPPRPDEDYYSFESTSSVVLPGDTVQFLAVFPGTQRAPGQEPQKLVVRKHAEEQTRSEEEQALNDNLVRIVIGTNPPENQYSATLTSPSQSEDTLRFLPNHFGMLSQGGACLGRTNGGGSATFTSRLDIPYTTIAVKAKPDFRGSEGVVRYRLSERDHSRIRVRRIESSRTTQFGH